MPSQAEKASAFRALHEAPEPFIIPNPWDAGTAKALTAMGFKALATTSSGYAFTAGKPDGALAVTREEVLANARAIAMASPLPVSADLENLYAHEPKEAAKTVLMAADAGLVGCSIEDWSGDADLQIYKFDFAVKRVAAAVEAARSLPFPFTLTARSENLIRNRKDLDDTIRRLQAYEAAGADVLYAPGLNDVAAIERVTSSVSKPVNALSTSANAHLSLDDFVRVGVKRISVGGGLARVATGAFLSAAREMAEHGTFTQSKNVPPSAELDGLLRSGGP